MCRIRSAAEGDRQTDTVNIVDWSQTPTARIENKQNLIDRRQRVSFMVINTVQAGTG